MSTPAFDQLACLSIQGAKPNHQTYFGVATALVTTEGHHVIIVTQNKTVAAAFMKEVGATTYDPARTHPVAVMHSDNVILGDDDEL